MVSMLVHANNSPDHLILSISEKSLNAMNNGVDARQVVERFVSPHVNFRVVSQRAVGKYWRRFTDDQKTRFTAAFSNLLINTYVTSLEEYTGGPPQILRSHIDGDRAQVQTTLNTRGGKVNIDYKLHQTKSGNWLIYDVAVAGISLVINYRNMYNQYLQFNSPDSLIEKIS